MHARNVALVLLALLLLLLVLLENDSLNMFLLKALFEVILFNHDWALVVIALVDRLWAGGLEQANRDIRIHDWRVVYHA